MMPTSYYSHLPEVKKTILESGVSELNFELTLAQMKELILEQPIFSGHKDFAVEYKLWKFFSMPPSLFPSSANTT